MCSGAFSSKLFKNQTTSEIEGYGVSLGTGLLALNLSLKLSRITFNSYIYIKHQLFKKNPSVVRFQNFSTIGKYKYK